jgi:hypothetical protein
VATLGSWSDGAEYDPDIVLKKSSGTWWPVGKNVVQHSQLKRLLAQSARWHARRSITLFVSDDVNELLEAAVSAGTAVELLAKTYLINIDPALLAEKGDRDTVLALGGNGALARVDPLLMKTIGAAEALRLVKYLHKELPWLQQDGVSLRVRNAAIHMALVRTDELRSAVLEMSRLIESLIVPLGLARDDFWDPHSLPAVNYLLDEAKSETARIVAAKVAAAQRYLARLVRGLSTESCHTLLTVLSGRPASMGIDHDEPQECPICKQQGWLICSVLEDHRREPDEYGRFSQWVDQFAYPEVFECPVCQFHVEGRELREFDFPTSIIVGVEEIERDD